MKSDEIKYIHIMSHTSMLYNKEIIQMIKYNDDKFNIKEHLFIISNKQVYEDVKQFDNVIFVENINSNVKVIEKYANMCSYIFLHCNTFSTKTLMILRKNVLNKIIWCVWGDDLYSKRKEVYTLYRKIRRTIGNIIRFIPEYIRMQRIKKFYAIGIGFQYDAIEVKRKYGPDMRIIMTPYGYKKDNKEKLDKIIMESEKKQKIVKVMVGHSAYRFLNHIEILKILEKYKNEDIKISLVLAYGEEAYKKQVIDYAINTFENEKLEIIEKTMEIDEYLKYLNTVDICILDYKHQAALGNIYYLLYMGKKLYLHEKGIIKLFTTLEGIENYNVSEIKNIDFEEFSKPIQDIKYGKQFAEFHIDEKNYVNLWVNTIKQLK